MKYFFLLCTIFSFFACEQDAFFPEPTEAEQRENYERALATELTSLLHPLTGVSPTLPTSDLAALDYLADAQVTGLGEATHGTHEFFAFKHRLFRYLVEEHGYRALVFEIDFAEALIFDDYVRNGTGPPDELMRNQMYLWLWQNQEVRDLLQWMRDYNDGRPAKDQVRFLGNDAQTTHYNADALLERLRPISPTLAEEVDRLTRHYRQLDRRSYAKAGVSLHQETLGQLRQVRRLLRNNENKLIATSSLETYSLLYQLSENLLATEALLWSEHQSPFVNRRDLRMAMNSQWWAQRLGAKTVIWSHNLHVGDHPVLLNSGAMGSYLKDTYGKAYQSIGFSFSEGEYLARGQDGRLGTSKISNAPPHNALAHYLDLAQEDIYFLRREEALVGSLTANLLQQPLGWYTAGASAGHNLRVLPGFDGLVHFRRVEASRRLP